MATMVPPQKNIEFIFYVGLVSQADTKLLQNNPTLAAGDVLVSTDGGGTTNLDTLPAVTPASSDMVKVTVSTTEMNGDNIIIVFSDVAGSEWCDLIINIQTSAQSLDTTDTAVDGIKTVTDAESGVKTIVADIHDTDLPAVKTDTAAIIADTEDLQGNVDTMHDTDLPAVKTVVDAIETDTQDLQGNVDTMHDTDLPAVKTVVDAIDTLTKAAGAGDLAAILVDTGTTLNALITTIDTVVDAIKAKTDNQPAGIQKNVAYADCLFLMRLSSDNTTPATGKSITAQISKDGGAFATCTNAVSEISNGIYKITITQAEMNADSIILKFSETDCDTSFKELKPST